MASDFEALGMGKPMSADFLELGKERTDAVMTPQKDLLDAYEKASDAWLARVKSEADLWSGLAAKLTKTGSPPESAAAYHEGLAVRMRMAAEAGQNHGFAAEWMYGAQSCDNRTSSKPGGGHEIRQPKRRTR
jgi:hypothetical protein